MMHIECMRHSVSIKTRPKSLNEVHIKRVNIGIGADPKLTCDSLFRMTEAQGLAYLSAIECRDLLILGDQGFPQLAEAQQRKEALKFNEEVTVMGGHHCHIESVEEVQ